MDKYQAKLNHIRKLHRIKSYINKLIDKEDEELRQMEEQKIQEETIS
jgi:hypothetical protein